MSQSVIEFVDGVDGVRGGVAEAIGSQFATVAELSQAEADRLTSVKGVGPVLAERILDAARTAVVANHTPDTEPDPDAATRARASVARAEAASRPALDVIEGGADVERRSERREVAEDDAVAVAVGSSTGDADLPPVIEGLATLLGTTIGWGIRVYRNVTRPVKKITRPVTSLLRR